MAKQTLENSSNKLELSAKSSSVQFMLAEFGRIQAGEIYNRNNGETRVNLYLTLLSFVGASIVALWQLTAPKDFSSLQTFLSIGFIAFLFVSLIGTITFRLLIERWHLTVIYLRKLARIRRWFLAQDIALENNLVYTTDETYPSFISKNLLSSSLITLISLLNSVTIATTIIFIIKLLFLNLAFLSIGFLGIAIAFIVWFTQRLFAIKTMSELEKDKNAAFPPLIEEKLKAKQ